MSNIGIIVLKSQLQFSCHYIFPVPGKRECIYVSLFTFI